MQLPQRDLEEIISASRTNLLQLDGAKILILGGTGFIGKWLVSTLITAQHSLGLKYEISIVTRSPEKIPAYFKHPGISYIKHDLTSGAIDLPTSDYYVHGSTPSLISTGSMNLQNVSSSTLNGTLSIARAIERNHSVKSVTYLSSGAVFGQQLLTLSHRPEGPAEIPNSTLSPYGVTKLTNELLIAQMKSNFATQISTPRLFAFYGPHVALDEHFAVGNFLRDARSGGPIKVTGNSQTTRSYMYPIDLINSLLQLVVSPEDTPINLGSADAITMQELAEKISSMFGHIPIQLLGEDKPSNNYVPETSWIFKKQQNGTQVKFEDGLKRWNDWLDNFL
jgi:dTDP-glucose 4,6-dehydratase